MKTKVLYPTITGFWLLILLTTFKVSGQEPIQEHGETGSLLSLGAPAITISAENNGIINCIFEEIEVEAIAGAGTFLWEGPQGFSSPNSLITISLPGEYTVLFTDENNNTATETLTIGQDIQKPGAGIAGNQQLNCTRLEVELTVLTDDENASYLWSTNETSSSITVDKPGTYTVRVSSLNGCSTETSVDVEQDITLPSVSIEGNQPLSCLVPKITLTAVGSENAVITLWNTDVYASSITVDTPGEYTARVVALNGCSAEASVRVEQISEAPEVSLQAFTPLCNNTTLNLEGGHPKGGTYYLNGEPVTAINTGEITAGFHQITYIYSTGSIGCTGQASQMLEVLQAPCFDLTTTNISCFGAEDGAIFVDIDKSCGEVTHICLEYVDANMPKCNPDKTASTADFQGLIPGTYDIIVTNSYGCTTIKTVTITEPQQLVASALAEKMIVCPEEQTTLTVTATGGTGEYTGTGEFVVGAGTHTYVVTDENGCEEVASITIDAHPLVEVTCREDIYIGEYANPIVLNGSSPVGGVYAGAGVVYDALADQYLFTASEAGVGIHTISYTVENNGCTFSCEFLIEVYSMPEFSCIPDQTLCSDQMPLEDLIPENSNGVLSGSGVVDNIFYPEVSGTGSFTLTYTVTDDFGYQYSCDFTLVVNEAPVVTLAPFASACTNVEGKILLEGGMPAGGIYTGTGVAEGMFDPLGLLPGKYKITYTYTNESDCTASATQTLEVLQAPCLEISHTDVSCNGANDGTITLSITCGDPIDICLIAPGEQRDKCLTDKSNNAMFTRLVPGTYTIVVTDANGCVSIEEVTITEPNVLSLEVESTDALCNDGFGSAEITVLTGGTQPYAFDWNGADPRALPAGNHTLLVTDARGCQANAEVTILEPAALTADASVVQPLCHDDLGSIDINVSGGTQPIEIHWGEVNPDALTGGDYNILITDANDCETTVSFSIVIPLPIAITAQVTDLEYYGDGTGAISLSVTGGIEPYDYLWDSGQTTASIENLQAGEYRITVTDANGCVASASYTVGTIHPPIDLGVTIEVNIATPDPEKVDELIFAIVVTNHDDEETATGVVIENPIPEPFPFYARLDDGSSGAFDATTGLWNIGNIPAGEYRILVYKTGMLLTEATETKSWQSADNIAKILPFDQVDPNLANNQAKVLVTVGESSGGGDNGIESNGSMAAQLALRSHRRLVENPHVEKTQRTIAMESFQQFDMLTGHVKTATLEGEFSSGIAMMIPDQGPSDTKAYISTPSDLLGITNAKEIFSVDYLQQNNSRRAAILAISTESSSVYEHTKVICDRLMGGELRSIEMIEIAGKPFILSQLVHPNGYIDYSVSFIAQRKGGEFVIDNRWYNEEYELLNSEDIFNFQVWSVTPQFTRELVEEILSTMEKSGGVSFRNEQRAPQIPQVYVHSGRYTNGGLLLNLVNKVGATQITINGSKSLYENAPRESMKLTLDIPTQERVEVFIPTGYLFDAGFSVSNNKDEAPDILYYADGAWMFDYDPGNAEVTHFSTIAEDTQLQPLEYKVERDASFRGRVRTWASMFRSLSPRNMPVNMSAFDQLVFNARGEGTVEIILAKESVNQWSEQYRTTITLTPNQKEFRISFNDLTTKEGVREFSANDLVSVIFNPLGNGSTAGNFEVNVSKLHFANSNYEIADNAIFYPAYPNPFRKNTSLDLMVTNDSHVRVEVVNVLGETIEVLTDEVLGVGSYKINWEAHGHEPGVYVFRITAGENIFTSKVIYQK